MSDIRYNQWLHNSGTGGVSQDAGGNIGIGTTAPLIPVGAGNTAILNVGVVTCNSIEVTGNVSVGGTLTYQDVTNIDSVGIITARDVIDAQGYINLAQKIIHTGDADTSIEFPSNDTIKFETAGTERLRIKSNGFVGIGTDNPDTKLEVWSTGNNNSVLKLSPGTTAGNYGGIELGRTDGSGNVRMTTVVKGGVPISGISGIEFGSSDTNLPAVSLASANSSNGHIAFRPKGTEKVRITSEGKVGIGTINPSGSLGVWDASGSDPTMSLHHSNADVEGEIIRVGRTDLPIIRYHSIKSKHGGAATANYIAFNLHNGSGTTNQTEVLRIVGNGEITTSGTTEIKPHSVGIGTTSTTNTGVGTAYGEMMYNTTDDKLQIYTKSNKWYNVHNWTDSVEGYYTSTTAASADGLNHYWPGNSSNSLISNLVPNNTSNSPVINLTVDSYHGTYPYFNFYSGNNELGWRFTKGGTKWGNGPFTIAFWVRPQASTLESESTFVQLGSHSGLRSLYTVSTDASRQLKAITIGDDTGVHSSATLSTGWQHVVVTYETNGNTKYYINGSNVRTFNHSGNLDVGTSSQYIYIGYGHWNSSSSNKASMSQMSDIGIWDSDALTSTEISNLYNAKRIIAGY